MLNNLTKIDLKYPKIIGDPIHGYVPLTELEYKMIQLPTLTRLHFVRQNALACFVFPGAVTSRFSHVVGALHIGGKLVHQLFLGINPHDFKKLFPDTAPETIMKSVRLACLFHDIGHGPFSHSAENCMLKITKKKYTTEIAEAKKIFDVSEDDQIPIHEFFSYKLINEGEIKSEIIRTEGNVKGNELINYISILLTKSKKNINTGWALLRKIVSSQLDADRMDYLLRDSMMSGVKFGLVDVDRIINNMSLIKNERYYDLAMHERAMGVIEDMLDARFKMYKWFYNHHTITIINELLNVAIDILTEEDDEIAKLFHWSEYKNGFSTDDYILAKLNKRIKEEKYKKVRGLIDRRFLPIPIFKSISDLGGFVDKVHKKRKVQQDLDLTKKFIINFFKKANWEVLFKDALEKKSNKLNQCIIFQTEVNMKPYEPFSESDRIYLFKDKGKPISELSFASTYFKTINDFWSRDSGINLFYSIPGYKKEELTRFKKDIVEIISTQIASYKING